MLRVVATEQGHDELRLDLDAIVREGARRMLAAALEAEVEDHPATHAAEWAHQGRRLVVWNGHARERMVGVRVDGTKELVVVADGEREGTDNWAELLGDLRRRGMRAPVVAVGDGALGLWAGLREVFSATGQRRDWVHKLASVLGCLPKAVQAGAGTALAEIRDAPRS